MRSGKHSEALRTYCVVCGQYVHMIGPGLKQHLRLAHPREYAQHQEEAESRCHGLGLPAESPCRFCKTQHKAPRVHLKRCPVLFQASFANLLVHESVQAAQHGCADGGTGSPGSGGVCGGVRGRPEGEGQGQGQGAGRSVAGSGAQAEVLPRGGEGRQRRLVECGIKLGPQGVVGPTEKMGRPESERQLPGCSDAAPDTGDGASVSETRARARNDQSRDGVYAVPGYPDAPSHVVSAEASGDCGRLDGKECCWAGEDGPQGDANDGAGQRASDEAGSFSRRTGEDHPGRGYRMDQPGIHRNGSGLALFRLESQDETAGTLGATPGVYQRSPDLPGHSVQEPGSVLQRFRSTKGLEGNFDSVEVVPFLLWIGLRSNQAHLCYQAFMQLAGSAVTKLLGLRIRPERLARQPAARKVEECFKAVSYCDWSNRS